jgi:hypothetical protein
MAVSRMTTLLINTQELQVDSIEELDEALSRSAQLPAFELWISVPDGPSMAMLRNGSHAWLMYLRLSGDPGFVSQGDATKAGTASYTLSNGQVDEHPLSWCIDVEQCFRAVMYFFVNNGAKPHWISWQES